MKQKEMTVFLSSSRNGKGKKERKKGHLNDRFSTSIADLEDKGDIGHTLAQRETALRTQIDRE